MQAILADTAKYISYLPRIEASYLKCLEIGEVPANQGGSLHFLQKNRKIPLCLSRPQISVMFKQQRNRINRQPRIHLLMNPPRVTHTSRKKPVSP